MRHEPDDDACCIHCGHDGAEEHHLRQLGYAVDRAPCPVWDERTRAANRQRYAASRQDSLSAYDLGDDDWDAYIADQDAQYRAYNS